jgi:flagellar motor protein MotB
MIGGRIVLKRKTKDDAERPFWISFADLMTALMVLFLVVMGVALLAVTKTVTERERIEEQHRHDIEALLSQIEEAAERYEGIHIFRDRRVIDFGDRVRFAVDEWRLSTEQETLLRRFVPEVLHLAETDLGKRVLKRIVVEGYTDRTGSYLGNLNLSLQRSQRVLCAMFATTGDALLNNDQKLQVRNLFLVGGFSFNATRDTDEASRRVEIRLEILSPEERRPAPPNVNSPYGECSLR